MDMDVFVCEFCSKTKPFSATGYLNHVASCHKDKQYNRRHIENPGVLAEEAGEIVELEYNCYFCGMELLSFDTYTEHVNAHLHALVPPEEDEAIENSPIILPHLHHCCEPQYTIKCEKTSGENEAKPFEAQNVNDEIQNALSKSEEMKKPLAVQQEPEPEPEPAMIPVNVEPDKGKSPCVKTEEFVVIVGGFDGSSWLLSLDSYSEDNVTSLCPMTYLRSYAAVAKAKRDLYLLGGLNGGVWCNTVEFYNIESNQWVQCAPLNQEKGNLAGASLNDKIYAIGGGNGVDCLSEVEVFDINQGKWIFTQSMMKKRSSPAAIDMNGALYVAGGYDGKNYLRSVERYDPREAAWTSLSNMNTNRGCHSVVAFNEKIYALGGYDGSTMVSTVEVFDPRVGLWMMETPMSVSRGYFGSLVCDGKIYAIGGTDGKKTFNVVECYDEGHGWEMIGPIAIGKRCYFSAYMF